MGLTRVTRSEVRRLVRIKNPSRTPSHLSRYTMRARNRELAKSTPMTMATRTSRIAEAAG